MNREDGSLFVIDPDEKISDDQCYRIVSDAFEKAWDFLQHHKNNDPKQGFVISGKALSCVFPHRKHDAKGREIPPSEAEAAREAEYQKNLLKCLLKCRAVLCCRVSPIQKAQMVALVKQNVEDVITLAIGDGANDVPMIRSAHVGIGISGQEGLQAVMASDYAIGQFRFLQELLLIHGAWDYRRISILILYSFYKNVMLSMTQMYFGFYSGFSGTLFYDNLAGSTYNLVYTCFPVMFAAVFDRYYSKQVAKLCPELYENGPDNNSFNLKLFIMWFCEGLLHGMVIFFCCIYFLDSSSIGRTGKMVGFWVTNTTMFTCVVTVATMKIMVETRTWNVYSVLFFFLSELSWFLYIFVWSSLPVEWGLTNQDIYGVAVQTFELPQTWFVIMLTAVICIYPDILMKFLKKMWKPTRLDVIEELEFIKQDFDFETKQCINYEQEREEFIDEMVSHIKQQQKPKIIPEPKEDVLELKESEKEPIIARPSTTSTDQEQKIAGEDEEEALSTEVKPSHTPRLVSTRSDLGFSEFQVGPEHSDYVMSQQEYIRHAMIKKQFSTRIDKEDSFKLDDLKENDNNNNFVCQSPLMNKNDLKAAQQDRKSVKNVYSPIAGAAPDELDDGDIITMEPVALEGDDDNDNKSRLSKQKSPKPYKQISGNDTEDDEDEDEMHPL